MMQVSIFELNQLLQGEIVGDGSLLINRPAKIEEGEEGAISFFANSKYEEYIYTCESSAILVPKDFIPKRQVKSTLIKVDNVRACLSVLLEHFSQYRVQREASISPQAFIHETAEIGEGVYIEPFVYVGAGVKVGKNTRLKAHVYLDDGVIIGENVLLHSGVKIYHNCVLENRVIIHANTVIGSDGFGFAPQEDGSYKKIPQLGNVHIKADVEIGANTVIDRAVMNSTVLEQGVKLDNLVQVAHNVKIGSHTVIAAQVGIAGSTEIGASCMIGGQAGFVGHIKVADNTKVQAQSGVARGVKKEGTALYGSPAIPYNDYLKSYVVFKNLPDMNRNIQSIQKQLNILLDELK